MIEPSMKTPATPEAVRSAFARLRQTRPDLRDVTDAFEEVCVTQARLAAYLPLVDLGLWSPPAAERRVAGVSLLADDLPPGLDEAVALAARTLGPVLAASFPAASDDIRAFALALEEGRIERLALVRAVLDRNRQGLADLAAAAGLSAAVAGFAAPILLAPALARLAEDLAPLTEGVPWNKGYCPVCGGQPALSRLSPIDHDERNEFLVGGGGKKFLVCSLCASQWHIPRVTCPVCECSEPKEMGFFRVEGQDNERIDYCRSCKTYLPCIDLRASLDPAPPFIAGLGLLHLDLLAQEQGYRPAAEMPWNRLE